MGALTPHYNSRAPNPPAQRDNRPRARIESSPRGHPTAHTDRECHTAQMHSTQTLTGHQTGLGSRAGPPSHPGSLGGYRHQLPQPRIRRGPRPPTAGERRGGAGRTGSLKRSVSVPLGMQSTWSVPSPAAPARYCSHSRGRLGRQRWAPRSAPRRSRPSQKRCGRWRRRGRCARRGRT